MWRMTYGHRWGQGEEGEDGTDGESSMETDTLTCKMESGGDLVYDSGNLNWAQKQPRAEGGLGEVQEGVGHMYTYG